MHKMPLWLLAWTAGLAGAQTVPLTANALANRDVVTLAKAGFNEDFIVDFIHTSQTHFDTSVTGLAELAKEGLTERLIRVMLGPASPDRQPSADRNVSAEGSAGETNPIDERVHVLKRSETAVALVNQTPYHRSMSLFWGLWKKQVEVGAASSANDLPSPLGKAYVPARTSRPTHRTASYVVYP